MAISSNHSIPIDKRDYSFDKSKINIIKSAPL